MPDDESTDASVTLFEQGGISFVGKIVRNGVRLLFVVTVTNLTTQTVYGLYTLALSIVLLLQGIATFGLNKAANYFIPRQLDSHGREKAGDTLRTLLVAVLISTGAFTTVVALSAGPLATAFGYPDLGPLLALLAFSLPLFGVNKVFVGFFTGVQQIGYRVYTEDIVRPVVQVGATVVAVLVGYDVLGLVGGYLVSLLVAVGVSVFLLVRQFEWTLRPSDVQSVPMSELLSYSFPLALAGMLYAVIGQIDFIIIGMFATASDVAVYRVVYLLTGNLVIFVAAVGPAFKPIVAKGSSTGAIHNQYRTTTRWVTMLTLPAAAVLLFGGRAYLSVLFPASYAVGTVAMSILAGGFVVNAIAGPDGMLLEGLGQSRLTFLNSVVYILVNLGLDLLLVPRFGIEGAAVATAMAVSLTACLGVGEAYYLYGMHPFGVSLGKALAAGIPASAAVIVLARTVGTLVTCVIAPIVAIATYVIFLWVFDAFTEADEQVARRIDRLLGRELFEPFVVDR